MCSAASTSDIVMFLNNGRLLRHAMTAGLEELSFTAIFGAVLSSQGQDTLFHTIITSLHCITQNGKINLVTSATTLTSANIIRYAASLYLYCDSNPDKKISKYVSAKSYHPRNVGIS